MGLLKTIGRKRMISKFKELLGDSINSYQKRSVYHSELYFFWKYSQGYEFDSILESGTYKGFSTNRLKYLFPFCDIITFEKEKSYYDELDKSDKEILYVHGELDTNLITNKTIVLIDGPKRKLATRLARKCIKKGALFVGIHDMFEYIKYLKTKFKHVDHTGYPPDEAKGLDRTIPKDLPGHNKKGMYGTVLAIVRN